MAAITQIIYRYCRSMDRMDKDLGYSIWHDNAEADYGETIYRGSGRGFIDFVTESHRPMIAQSHQIANVIIELDGDAAAGESYVTAALRFCEEGSVKQITTRGRYLDRWSYRLGRSGIDKRRYVHDFDEIRPIEAGRVPPSCRRDRQDPSYETFEGFV